MSFILASVETDMSAGAGRRRRARWGTPPSGASPTAASSVSALVLFLPAVILFTEGSARGAATTGAGPGSAGRGAGRTRPASGSAAPAAPVRNVASFQKIQIISM